MRPRYPKHGGTGSGAEIQDTIVLIDLDNSNRLPAY